MATSAAARRRARHLAALSVNASNPVNWDHPLNRGLVSWWLPLPGRQGGLRLWDLCGRNHCSLQNGPGWVGGRNGYLAVERDGSNDLILSDSVVPFNLSKLTVSIVFSLPSLPSAYKGLTGQWKDDGGASQRSYVLGTTSGNSLYALTSTDGSYQAAREFGDGTAALTAGKVHHGVLAYTSATGAVLYMDGAQRATNGQTGNLHSSTDAFRIGAMGFASSFQYLAAKIYECSVRDRALSASEVLALYDQSRQGHPDTLARLSTVRYFVPAAAPAGSILPILMQQGLYVSCGGGL